MRILLLVALCACSVPQIDYTGKACLDRACPAGYECNLATNTCARDITMDGPVTTDDARPDAAVDRVADSCFQNPRGKLVYSSDFTDYPQGWQVGGSGNWEKRDSELYQSSSVADSAWVSHAVMGNGSGGGADYRLVATMRLGDLSNGSVGIAFRVGAQTMYSCAVEPLMGRVALRYMQQGIDVSMATKPVSMSNPLAPFTMEIDASGANLSCCMRGISDATLSVLEGQLASGRAGVATRNDEGAFSSFYAYE